MAVIDSTMTESGEKNPGIEAQRAKTAFIFSEDVAPGLKLEMDLHKILFTGVTEFQQIDVVETYFGKVKMDMITIVMIKLRVFV